MAIALAVGLSANTAWAQSRSSSRSSGGAPWAYRGETVYEYLKRRDVNGNGVIEPEEIHDRLRTFYEASAKQAGLDVTKPMPIDRLAEGMQKAYQQDSTAFGSSGSSYSRSSSSSGNSSSTSGTATAKPVVGGFGAPAETAKLPAGFSPDNKPAVFAGTTVATTSTATTAAPSSATATSGTSSSTPSANTLPEDKIRRYAESLLRQYDENKNGQLEKNEWSRMNSELQKADLNNDGIITLDELVKHLTNANNPKKEIQNSSSTSSSNSSNNNSSGNSSSSKSAPPPSSSSASNPPPGPPPGSPGGPPPGGPPSGYRKDKDPLASVRGKRFLTPTERLPDGLPDWFIRCDIDGDGQVTMAEFTKVWTEDKAAEFARYDLNGDGFLTPQEVLQVERNSQKKK